MHWFKFVSKFSQLGHVRPWRNIEVVLNMLNIIKYVIGYIL